MKLSTLLVLSLLFLSCKDKSFKLPEVILLDDPAVRKPALDADKSEPANRFPRPDPPLVFGQA